MEQFEKVKQVTAHAILEKRFEGIHPLFCQVHPNSMNNYTNSVGIYKQNIIFLGSKTIYRGRIFSWKEYIDFIKEKYDWLAVLKIALEIYNGDLKGYAKIPDEKEVREAYMKTFMKELLKSSIETTIYKFKQKGNSASSITSVNYADSGISMDHQADQVAIKVAIEFCLSINATDFLFADIFMLF